MNKWVKITLWILSIIVIAVAGLAWLGYSLQENAADYVRKEGGYKDVRTLMSSEKVLCSGPATGFIVGQFDTEEETYFPICVTLMQDVTMGKWDK
jgi:hypothetical protein